MKFQFPEQLLKIRTMTVRHEPIIPSLKFEHEGRTSTIASQIELVLLLSVFFHVVILGSIYVFTEPKVQTQAVVTNTQQVILKQPALQRGEKDKNPLQPPSQDTQSTLISTERDAHQSRRQEMHRSVVKEFEATSKSQTGKIEGASDSMVEPETIAEKVIPTTTTKKPKAEALSHSARKKNAESLVDNDLRKNSQGVVNFSHELKPDASPNKNKSLTTEEQRIVDEVTQFAEHSFKRILALWVKPRNYPRKLSGVIRIIVNEDGFITRAYISKSSGDATLDMSVLEAANRAKRFYIPLNSTIDPGFFSNLKLDFDSDM